MPKRTRIPQKKIAQDLGVSQTLVSMALSGKQTGISEETYQKIWRHARQVGYTPKGAMANSPVGSRMTVGFILREGLKLYNQSPFFGHVQHGLHELLLERGMNLTYLGTEKNLEKTNDRTLFQQYGSLAGLVIFGEVSLEFLQALKEQQPRLVVVSAQFPGICHSVTYNEDQAANLLVAHLMDLGHHSFAWLGGPLEMQRVSRRRDATLAAVNLRGLSIDSNMQISAKGAERIDGRSTAKELICRTQSGQRPTAWVCFNGLMARGATNYLLHKGIRVPDDISVVNFDQTRICEEEIPHLTSASAKPELLGRVTGEIIINLASAESRIIADTVLPSELCVRASSGCVNPCGPKQNVLLTDLVDGIAHKSEAASLS